MKHLFRAISIILLFSLLAGCAAQATPIAATATTKPISIAAGGFETLIPIAKTFIESLAKGDYTNASANFDATMQGAFPPDKMKQTMEQLVSNVGAYQRQTGTRTETAQGYRIVYVTIQFEKTTLDARVPFNTAGQISGLQFVPLATPTPAVSTTPPAYVNSGSFHEVDVTVGSGQWALPGTLSLPNGSGPFPAVVLVHGSGPNDRDETIGPNKPFRDLAWGLASQGIAVLRYDKRTFAHKDLFTADVLSKLTTKEETTDDALLAVQLLRQTSGIDPKRVFVLGHSLGATMAPRIGQQDPSLAGLIILAGITRPFEDVVLDQYTYLYSLNGGPTSQQVGLLEVLKAQVAAVKDPNLSLSTKNTDLPLSIYPAYWLDLRGYQPAEVAKTLKMPLLVLQGGRDYQVSATKDFPGWQAALSGNPNDTLKVYPDLNHVFISGSGPATPSEYQNPGNVSPEVVSDIGKWVLGH